MKLHKVVNREYHGKTYFRWILMVPPKVVGELGWRDGEEIAMEVRGRALKVQPTGEEKTEGTRTPPRSRRAD